MDNKFSFNTLAIDKQRKKFLDFDIKFYLCYRNTRGGWRGIEKKAGEVKVTSLDNSNSPIPEPILYPLL